MRKGILIICCMIILGVSSVYAVGVGISPATINIGRALPGESTSLNVQISNPSNEEETILLNLGGECSEWTELSTYYLKVPSQSNEKVKLTMTPPDTAQPKKTYKCELVASVGVAEEGGGMSTLFTTKAPITVEIGGEAVRLGELIDFTSTAIKQGDTGAFRISFKNTGNVDLIPLSIGVHIYDSYGDKVARVAHEGRVIVSPGERADISVEWETPEDLPAGIYKAVLVIPITESGTLYDETSFEVKPSQEAVIGTASETVKTSREWDLPISSASLLAIIFVIAAAILWYYAPQISRKMYKSSREQRRYDENR